MFNPKRTIMEPEIKQEFKNTNWNHWKRVLPEKFEEFSQIHKLQEISWKCLLIKKILIYFCFFILSFEKNIFQH